MIKKGTRPQGGIQHFNMGFYLLVFMYIKISEGGIGDLHSKLVCA